ncbi:ATP phosphoribosyltransferase regulatory subunit [Brevibacillus dissolubilis]|uniref:ATP phosphoribosyltransferase regulatory subunit n=1 Tax=Brevibacillus dissolubilis TaxID=1844116 RepID=UPI0011163938|nr:ATP phosphoribosyltransferase regulatory subunit [Brevibacillus dissolubilis]
MAKPLVFEKPLGMRDILPESLAKHRKLESVLRGSIEKWGYEEITTPSLEYFDTVGAACVTLEGRMFKLLDKQGHTVILRPEMTAPIARVVSSLYKHVPLPIRLYYQANVFRAQEKEAGRPAEFFQTGVELIGEASVDGDAEAIALAVACLQAAQVPSFKIAIGHVDFIDGLLDEIVKDPQIHTQFRAYLHDRDYVGYRQLVESLELSDDERRRLHALMHLRGGKSKIAEAHELTINGKARKAVQTIASLWEALEAYGVTDHLLLDFNLFSNFNYYTGTIFEGYSADLGSPLLGGGRYDTLLEQFGRPAPATGFAINMDRLNQVTTLTTTRTEQRLVIAYAPDRREEALRQAQAARQTGRVVITRLLTDGDVTESLSNQAQDEIMILTAEEGEV